jgi:predicted DNA-binding transcriptional regulator AlpA
MRLPDPDIHPFISADEAFAILGIDRKTGYRAIREGSFPVAVVRVGRLIRVPSSQIVRLVHDTAAGTEAYSEDALPSPVRATG